MLDALTMGSSIVEFIPEKLSARLRDIRVFRASVGGSATNMAVAMSRLGLRVGIISRTGADEFGQMIINELGYEGINVAYIKPVEKYLTGISFYQIDPSGEKTYFFYRFRGYSMPEEIWLTDPSELEVAGQSKSLVLTEAAVRNESSRTAAIEILQRVSKSGGIVVYDPNLRGSLWELETAIKESRRIISLVDVVTPNLDEVMKLTGVGNIVDAGEQLLKMGVRIVAVKQGNEGCTLMSRSRIIHVPGFKVKASDDTGAGDAFCAGLVYGLLKKWDTHRIGLFANAVAALKVSRIGVKDAMPRMSEVEAFIRMGKT